MSFRAARIDPNKYTGLAFGCGINNLDLWWSMESDVRHFSKVASSDFLEQCSNMKLAQLRIFSRIAFRALCIVMRRFGCELGCGDAAFRWPRWRTGLGESGTNHLESFVCIFVQFWECFIWFDYGDELGFLWISGYLKLGQIRSARISGWILSLFAICMMGVATLSERYNAAHLFSPRHRDIDELLWCFFARQFELFNSSWWISSFSFRFAAVWHRLRDGQFWFVIVRSFIGFCDDLGHQFWFAISGA